MKYVVAYKVPEYVRQVIDSGYKRVTGRNLPAKNLHISLIYPFTIHSTHDESWVLKKLQTYEFESIDSRLSRIDVFHQKKQQLYIEVQPKDDYMAAYLTIKRLLRSGIAIDTRPFVNGDLPAFLPHIGIDYDFDGDHLTLHSLRLERIEAWFESGEPRLYKFDEKSFLEVE